MIELCEATEDNPFIHGMSKQFVKALQQLFDVMDTEKMGTIRFNDLASQWYEDDGDPYFPKGLITCLAKVQLPNGQLTFDRFCAGIRLCLLKNQVDIEDVKLEETSTSSINISHSPNRLGSNNNIDTPTNHNHSNSTTNSYRPSSEPQIFAPPPPTLSGNFSHFNNNNSNNNEVNNNNIYNNKTISMQSSSPTISSNRTIPEESTSTMSKSPKKLPLPSYEQVMAAKSKPSPKLPNELQQQTTNTSNTTSVVVDEPNQQLKASTMPKSGLNVSKSINVMQMALPIEQEKKLIQNSGYFPHENHYGTTNRIISNQQNHKPIIPVHVNASRTKSLSHLDFMANHHQIDNHEMANICPTAVNEQQNHLVKMGEMVVNENKSFDKITSTAGQQLTTTNITTTTMAVATIQPKTVSRNCIMKTLQSWRDNILNKQSNSNDLRNDRLVKKNSNANQIDAMINGDDVTSITSSLHRNSIRRREPRRHTVGANGIDIYAVKRFHQLEQEKDILMRGLNELEKTKEWYIRQISSIQDKINFAGRCGLFPSDCNIDAYQERINFQAVRIQTLNHHLMALREAGQSFPIHMNLAIRPLNGIVSVDPNQPKQLVVNPNLVNKLKEQNRLLTDEVTRKSERITQLEREKSSLIRELFQARTYSSYYNGHFDDTFM